MDLRENILQGTLEVFNSKGLKFTMDDIAKNRKISKKTIYKVFHDKDSRCFTEHLYGYRFQTALQRKR